MGRNDKNFISCLRHSLAYTTSTTQPHEHSRIIPLTTSSARRSGDSNWVSTIKAIVIPQSHSIQFCPHFQKSQTRRLSLIYQVSSYFAPSLHLRRNSRRRLPRPPTLPWRLSCPMSPCSDLSWPPSSFWQRESSLDPEYSLNLQCVLVTWFFFFYFTLTT